MDTVIPLYLHIPSFAAGMLVAATIATISILLLAKK